MVNTVSSRSKGKFEPAYTDQEFLDAIKLLGGTAETSSIASEVGCNRKTASTRLKALSNKDKIDKEIVGNSALWEHKSNTSLDRYIDFLSDYISQDSRLNMDAKLGMVITIRKQHSQAILNGEKEIEFRRTLIDEAKSPSVAFIYEPNPTKGIVGLFQIESIEIHNVEHLLEVGPKRTPSTKQSLKNYFDGKEKGTAIYIQYAKKIFPPIPLKKNNNGDWIFNPPQDFYYVDPIAFSHKLKENYLKPESPGGKSHELGDFVGTS